MLEQRIVGAVEGRIRRRLLVNALVDPDEVTARLPNGLRPHVVEGGTVVGCCLLDLEHVRPAWAPGVVGVGLRAAAHRVSVEWRGTGGDRPTVGVYVPLRHTDSRLAVLAGGRAFPGVHRRAHIDLLETATSLAWNVDAPGRGGCALNVVASATAGPEADLGPVGRACIDASAGLSPARDDDLEGVVMTPAHRRARRVDVEFLDSAFITAFASATPAPSYLMADVDVTWVPGPSVVREPAPIS